MPRYLVPNFEQPDWQAGAMPCAVDKGSASPGLIQGLIPPCELPDHFAPSCLTTDATCSHLTPSVPSRACLVPEVFADGRHTSPQFSVQLFNPFFTASLGGQVGLKTLRWSKKMVVSYGLATCTCQDLPRLSCTTATYKFYYVVPAES